MLKKRYQEVTQRAEREQLQEAIFNMNEKILTIFKQVEKETEKKLCQLESSVESKEWTSLPSQYLDNEILIDCHSKLLVIQQMSQALEILVKTEDANLEFINKKFFELMGDAESLEQEASKYLSEKEIYNDDESEMKIFEEASLEEEKDDDLMLIEEIDPA